MAQISTDINALTVGGLPGTSAARLSDWYGEPLEAAAAGAWLAQVHARQRARLRAGRSCFRLQVLAMVCHEWLGSEPELAY